MWCMMTLIIYNVLPDFPFRNYSSIVKYNVRKQIVKRTAKEIYTVYILERAYL